MESLYQQYRPKRLPDVVGQDQAIAQINAVARRGLSGKAYYVCGSSGVGKSTLAAIMASEVADVYCTRELNADSITLSELNDIEREMQMYGMGKKTGRAYIINEAHGMKAPIIRRLLIILEAIPQHVMFVFTTTRDGQDQLFDGIDGAPLLSRCIRLSLNDKPREAFAQRVSEIAKRENLDGQPIEAYLKLADGCACNMRAMLQAVESGQMLTGAPPMEPAKPVNVDLDAARARIAAVLAAKGGAR